MISPAHAQTKALSRAGNWQAFGGSVASPTDPKSSKPVCGISQATTDDSYFGIKFVTGMSGVTVQVGRKAWPVTNQSKIKVMLRFDAAKPWMRDAQGIRFNDGDAGLQFALNRAEFDNFAAEFRGGTQLHVQPDGMAEWVIDLAGSNAISNAFQDCIRAMR
ncbi:MAG: hypothetical protein JOY81_05510 [Alphaproteobacteria bacterium]|nr:hypothetical protein [Alphaproteobacteria bacterium]